MCREQDRSRKSFIKHLVFGWDGVFCCFLRVALSLIVLALGRPVLGDGLQLGDVADAFGHALSEEQLSSHLQVFWVLEELEHDNCFFPCPQLLLW